MAIEPIILTLQTEPEPFVLTPPTEPTTKYCYKCGETKSIEDFFKNADRKDGLHNLCKSCDIKRKTQWNRKNRHRVNELARIEKKKRWDANLDQKTKALYALNNKPKAVASKKVRKAIKNGTLIRMPCEVCGVEHGLDGNVIYAHHDDYAKPLEVRWLCGMHHKDWHKENGEAPNGKTIIHEDEKQNERYQQSY